MARSAGDVSNSCLTYVFEKSAARGGARLVLLALADQADEAGRCWPAVGTIARRAGVSEGQARKLLRQLVNGGELCIVQHGGGVRGGSERKGRPNVYQLVRRHAPTPAAELQGAVDGTTPPETLAPALGLEASDTLATGNETPAPARANPSAGARIPYHRRGGNPQEPTVDPPAGTPKEKPTERDGNYVGNSTGGTTDEKRDLEALQRVLTRAGITIEQWRGFPPAWQIRSILAECGCDQSFREHVANHVALADVLLVAVSYERQRRRIKNPGAWFRDQLERAGVLRRRGDRDEVAFEARRELQRQEVIE